MRCRLFFWNNLCSLTIMENSRTRRENFAANLRAALKSHRRVVFYRERGHRHRQGETAAALCDRLGLGEAGYRWLRKLASKGASHIRGKRRNDLDAICKALGIDPRRLWDTPAPPIGNILIDGDKDRVAIGWNPANRGWSKYPLAKDQPSSTVNISSSADTSQRCDDAPSLHEVLALGVAEWCRRHNADYNGIISELFSKLGFVQTPHSPPPPATAECLLRSEEPPPQPPPPPATAECLLRSEEPPPQPPPLPTLEDTTRTTDPFLFHLEPVQVEPTNQAEPANQIEPEPPTLIPEPQHLRCHSTGDDAPEQTEDWRRIDRLDRERELQRLYSEQHQEMEEETKAEKIKFPEMEDKWSRNDRYRKPRHKTPWP